MLLQYIGGLRIKIELTFRYIGGIKTERIMYKKIKGNIEKE